MRSDRGVVRTSITVAALALAVVFAVSSTLRAVDERQSEAAAMNLLMAATTVGHADQLRDLGGDYSTEAVARSVAALSEDRELALSSLSDGQMIDANRLLDEIIEDGNSLLDATEPEHSSDGHRSLQELLRTATQRSSQSAADAERRAAISLASMVIAAGLAVALATWSRLRSVRTRALAAVQARAAQRLQVLLNDSPDILLVIDTSGRINYRSASSTSLLEPSNDSLDDLVRLARPHEQQSFRSHLDQDAAAGASTIFELVGKGHESRWFDVRVSDLTDHELVEGHLLTLRDVSNEIRLRHELQDQANTDVLTGLPNRRVLQSSLEAAQAALETGDATVALMTLDIDGFKSINDTFGHLTGDELLVQVAARLNKATRNDEHLIRLGGDEFAIILADLPGSAAAEVAAHRLLKVLDEPFRIGDRSEHVRTSIGVAITDDPHHAPFLLGEADVALYEAKRLGGDVVVVFEAALASTSNRRERITRALREADYDNEFRMVYQPIVTTDSREVSTLEALLRWNCPTLGELSPAEFIPVAELTGEICPIGKWVFDKVCQQLSEWTAAGMDENISLSINVSPRQLAEAPFVACVLDTAEAWGIDPARLIIEVTESAALDHSGRAQSRLEQLRAAGLRISIDDFGSGYSNLGQLIAVPFDVIKIDRSLLLTLSAMREQAGGDPTEACSIMEAIVSIASILDAPVVCEGVETEDQFTSLRASGITHVQGFLTGRPTPPDQIPELIGTPAI